MRASGNRAGSLAILAGGAVIASLGFLAYASGSGSVRSARRMANGQYPHMKVAVHELWEARAELKSADHDFGGHRVAAIKAVDQAISQLEQALQNEGR